MIESRSELMKLNSRSLIIQCISRASAMSRAQIAKETGLSRAYVCNVVDELLADGELNEVGSVRARRGRPTTLLEINRNSCSVGGVWLAEDEIEIGIAGATGEITNRLTLDYSGNSRKDVDAIAEAVKSCAEQSGNPGQALRGVGVVVAGQVNPALGVISYTAHPENNFGGVPITKRLHEKLGVPVYADTDIRAAAAADQWNNAKSDRVLYVQFGNGVGAAFVVGGELFGGTSGAAPNMGHILVGPEGPNHFLEPCCSDYAFVERLWPDTDARRLAPSQLHKMVRQGVDLAKLGDYDAVAAVTGVAEYMGMGLSVAVSMLDPQKVYVTGTLLECLPDTMIGIIRRETIRRLEPQFTGVDIQHLVGWQDFELRGAFNLVLLAGFRTLKREINAQMIAPWESESRVVSDDRYGPVVVGREVAP